MPMPSSEPSDVTLSCILQSSRLIAVLGIHDDQQKAASYVPAYLHSVGYAVVGINPKLAGQIHVGNIVSATLCELTLWLAQQDPPATIDILNIFRRADLLNVHVDEILAAQPRTVWLQVGIRNDEFATRLRQSGITVIQDRCTLAEHRRLL
jgi:uncharacterized protein